MDEKELAGKTVAELKDIAKGLEIEHISGMKKADLVAAIVSKGAAESPAAPKKSEGKPAAAKSPSGAQQPKGGEKDILALKKEKKSLKAKIAEAIAAGDRARAHELRRRKARLRRILNRAETPAPPAGKEAPPAKPE